MTAMMLQRTQSLVIPSMNKCDTKKRENGKVSIHIRISLSDLSSSFSSAPGARNRFSSSFWGAKNQSGDFDARRPRSRSRARGFTCGQLERVHGVVNAVVVVVVVVEILGSFSL